MKLRAILLIVVILIISGCGEEGGRYQGYVEGEFLYLGSSQPGRMEVMAAKVGQEMSEGAVVFQLASDYEETLVRQAEAELAAARDSLNDMKSGLRQTEIAAIEAQVAQAKASLENSAANLKRTEALYQTKTVPKAQLDSAKAVAEADAARVEQLSSQLATAKLPTGREEQIRSQAAKVGALTAALDQAQWRLNEKSVLAPTAGLVYDIFFRPGEWVGAGSPVVRFLPPENVKVRFFVPQEDFGRLSLGQEVVIEVDGQAGLPARITYLSSQAEYTPPIIYSNENRSKLTFMVEARPEVADGRLNPGQPVEVKVKLEPKALAGGTIDPEAQAPDLGGHDG